VNGILKKVVYNYAGRLSEGNEGFGGEENSGYRESVPAVEGG